MSIAIVAVGRLKSGSERTLIDTYIKRTPWPIAEIEVEERRPLSGPERMVREGELLLKALPDGAMVIALDSAGRTLSSDAFAKKLGAWRESGRVLAFVIGGAEGLSPPVLARADETLSLSAMTWPHALARVLLAEQLYRAHAILSGHPYHK
ncbi:MAG: 23S rRNA (pseudouridine(1915)-N(3))-methyltransferase RlmH [Sphingomonadales bacterium]|nr:23S rRNA (pseudouridine(1915)-N(3))-methyltransferase RlmH [Sphingomonadales bacterium]